MVMNITNLTPGDIYAPKFQTSKTIELQVGVGGYCGVYSIIYEKNFQFLFRVLVNTSILKKDWKLIEKSAQIRKEISDYAFYGENDIGTDNYFKVSLEDACNRVPIKKSEYKKLEKLASCSTLNIINRININE